MNRRGFLSLLAPAAALIVAPELLIPRKTFFLPPAGGWGSVLGHDDVRRMKEAMLRQAEIIANPPVSYDIVTDTYKPIYLVQWGDRTTTVMDLRDM